MNASAQAAAELPNPELAKAYFRASSEFERLAFMLERLREMTLALAASENLEEMAQHCFYLTAQLAEQLREETKKADDEFTELAAKYR